MRSLKYIGLLLHILCIQLVSEATDTLNIKKVMTLEEILSKIEENPALAQYTERVNAINAYAKSVRAWEPPTVESGLWMTPYNLKGDMGAFMISGRQMIPNPAMLRAEEKYMKSMSGVEEQMKKNERQELIVKAKQLYYEWLVLEKKKKVLIESQELLDVMIKSAEIGFTYNQNLLSRVYKAKSELYNLYNMQVMYENEIRQKNIQLNTIMNQDKSFVFQIDTSYQVSLSSDYSVDSISLLASRSDLQQIEESVKALQLKQRFEQSKRYPQFGIEYGHMSSFGSVPNQFNLMGMVTIPIAPWSDKGYKASIKGAGFEIASLERRKEAIINKLMGELSLLLQEIHSKQAQIEMYEKNILPVLEKNYKASLVSFEHMKEDLFMAIDAWMALKMAKIAHLDLIAERLMLEAAYERIIEKE
ncbi:MAG TPA: TolC family protein [Cytophagaceae bacterium]